MAKRIKYGEELFCLPPREEGRRAGYLGTATAADNPWRPGSVAARDWDEGFAAGDEQARIDIYEKHLSSCR